MQTSREFLDRLAAKLNDASDYKVAKELGVTKQTVSLWRLGKGTIGEDAAVRVAEILGEDPKFVLSCVLAEKSTSKKGKQVLKQIADSFRGAAIFVIAFGAGILGLFVHSPASAVQKTSMINVYYGK